MDDNKLKFLINNDYYLLLEVPCTIETVGYFCDVSITLYKNKTSVCVLYDNDNALHGIECLKIMAQATVDGKNNLPAAIQEDLGYLWNEILARRREKTPYYVLKDSKRHWKGKKYLLWDSNASDSTTWLYVKNNTTFLVITPAYRWHFMDPEPGEHYISYDEFIKDYKPIIQLTLEPRVIQEWLRQTTNLYNSMRRWYEIMRKEQDIEKTRYGSSDA